MAAIPVFGVLSADSRAALLVNADEGGACFSFPVVPGLIGQRERRGNSQFSGSSVGRADHPEVVTADGGDCDARLAEFRTPLLAADKNFKLQSVWSARQVNLSVLFLISRLKRA